MAGSGVRRSGSSRAAGSGGAATALAAPQAVAVGNAIHRTGPAQQRRGRAPLGFRANAARSYRPVTPRGKEAAAHRQITAVLGSIKAVMNDGLSGRIRRVRSMADALTLKMARRQARYIAQRSDRGVNGQVARMMLRLGSSRDAIALIQRRSQRAADAAARGSKPAQRALTIYGNQIAGTGPGKPSRGKSNLRPGPRNATGKPPRRRRKPK